MRLYDFIPKPWLQDDEVSKVRFDTFSSNYRKFDTSLLQRCISLCHKLSGDDCSVFFGHRGEFTQTEIDAYVYYQDGIHQQGGNIRKRSFSGGDYVCIVSKVNEGAGTHPENAAREKLNFAIGLMTSLFGYSICHSHCATEVYDLESHKISGEWTNIKVHNGFSPEALPFWKQIDSLIAYLSEVDPSKVGQIELAFTLAGKAEHEIDLRLKILNLWGSLEAIFGSSRKLRSAIDKLTRKKSPSSSELRELKRKRDATIHRGEYFYLPPEEQTTAQALLFMQALNLTGVAQNPFQDFLEKGIH